MGRVEERISCLNGLIRDCRLRATLTLAALSLRVHVPVGAAAGGTNRAIGHRCHLLAWPPARQVAGHGSTPR
jgi:hypothetical protein